MLNAGVSEVEDTLEGVEGMVSIIVPTRNSSATLRECLESLRAQTHMQIEIIVVDNYSTDNTREIASSFGAEVLLCGGERSRQVNCGAHKSKGEFIYRVDSDFVLEPTVVAECVAACGKENIDGILVHNASDPSVSFWARVRNMEREMYRDDDLNVAVRFFTKSAFMSLGGFDENLVTGEDYDLHNRFLNQGFKYSRVDGIEIHRGEPRGIAEIIRKHYYYGKTLNFFVSKNKYRAFRQLSPFRPAFVKHRSLFAGQLRLTLGFSFYTLVRYLAALMGTLTPLPKATEVHAQRDYRMHVLPGLPPLKHGAPLISIIIPTKNSAKSIVGCIRSVLSSELSGMIEIIVVDNNSTDGTLAVARSLGVTVLTAGPERSAQRNAGAARANGEYLLFVDSDMEVPSSVLSECLGAINRKFDAALISDVTVGTGYWGKVRELERRSYFGDSLFEAARLFRRKAFVQLGGYSEEFTGLEDYDIQARLEHSHLNLVHLNSVFLHHEEGFNLGKHLLKKYYYARQSYGYIFKYPKRTAAQFFPLRRAFLKRQSPVLRRPSVFLGLILLKLSETTIAAIGVAIAITQKRFSAHGHEDGP